MKHKRHKPTRVSVEDWHKDITVEQPLNLQDKESPGGLSGPWSFIKSRPEKTQTDSVLFHLCGHILLFIFSSFLLLLSFFL